MSGSGPGIVLDIWLRPDHWASYDAQGCKTAYGVFGKPPIVSDASAVVVEIRCGVNVHKSLSKIAKPQAQRG